MDTAYVDLNISEPLLTVGLGGGFWESYSGRRCSLW